MATLNRHDDSFAFVLATTARLMKARFEVALRDADLDVTPAEARTLAIADRLAGPKQTELAATMGIEPMSLVKHLDQLEKKGLIRRTSDPTDRRIKLVQLTETAKPELRRIRQVFDGSLKSAMANFSASDRDLLFELLQRLSRDLLDNI